jgi:hypothetical protein
MVLRVALARAAPGALSYRRDGDVRQHSTWITDQMTKIELGSNRFGRIRRPAAELAGDFGQQPVWLRAIAALLRTSEVVRSPADPFANRAPRPNSQVARNVRAKLDAAGNSRLGGAHDATPCKGS